MKPKKVVSRYVAIGLGVLCIILFFTLVGILNYYAEPNSRIASLQSQIDSLNRIIELQEFMVWENATTISQPAGYNTGMNFTANYAGYVVVNLLYSTTSNTTVGLMYTYGEGTYYDVMNVGSYGTVWFPVLPATISVMVGNTNPVDSAVEVVSILYYY
jgi:hypothetical protein